MGNSECFLEKIYYSEVDLPAEQEWKHECERMMQRALLRVTSSLEHNGEKKIRKSSEALGQ